MIQQDDIHNAPDRLNARTRRTQHPKVTEFFGTRRPEFDLPYSPASPSVTLASLDCLAGNAYVGHVTIAQFP
jgi:hypothetical protein